LLRRVLLVRPIDEHGARGVKRSIHVAAFSHGTLLCDEVFATMRGERSFLLGWVVVEMLLDLSFRLQHVINLLLNVVLGRVALDN